MAIYIINPANFDAELEQELMDAIVPYSAGKRRAAYFGDFLEYLIDNHFDFVKKVFKDWQEEQLVNAELDDELVGISIWDEEYIKRLEGEAV